MLFEQEICASSVAQSTPPVAPADLLEDSLTQWLGSMVRGDQTAMANFYRATVAQVTARARAILATREDAEEVVGDVYLYVWRHPSVYDPSRGTVRAWLSVIARHRAIDRFRRGRRTVSLDDVDQTALVESLTCCEVMLAHAVPFHWSGAAHQALATLTPLRRRLLDLAFVRELTHPEIAVAVGLPLGTVKSHLRRALACLRRRCVPVD